MRKIPTLFIRDENDRRYVTEQVNPGCEWVLAGEGTPTRKYDGTCVMLDTSGKWWARREVKPGKVPPLGYVNVDHDEVTGKNVGWEPAEQSSFAKWLTEALLSVEDHAFLAAGESSAFGPGTYELIGPKVNGNPEAADTHRLVRHETAERLDVPELTFAGIRKTVLALAEADGCEGVVWHHDDGRMAKIKARDFQSGPATT